MRGSGRTGRSRRRGEGELGETHSSGNSGMGSDGKWIVELYSRRKSLSIWAEL
jgi:hypothetical protein